MRPTARRWLVRLVAMVLVPLALLAGTELLLRAVGAGYPTSFFVEAEIGGERLLVENARFAWRFFPRRLARAPLPMAVRESAPDGALRIVCFGESATKGEPEPAFGFPRVLEVLLEERLGRDVEVVNLGVTAISSHVILPIAREATRLRADYWVVYAGNNEVMGPFGAGSIFGARATSRSVIRASLAAKSLRIGQVLEAMASAAGGADERTWAGMDMFLAQQIRLDDPRLQIVRDNFRANLRDILATGRDAGARVIVSTMVSNLRDWPPFGSSLRPDTSPEERERWTEAFERGSRLHDSGDLAGATAAFREAAVIDDSHALLRFRLGECESAAGSDDEARKHFVAARDLDTIRFRTDSGLNTIIREVSAETSGVESVDAERVFADAAPQGLPGYEHLHEHVHFNFAGNHLLARAFAERILEDLVARGEVATSPPRWASLDECAERLAFTPWERGVIVDEMRRRFEEAPYVTQLRHDERRDRLTARYAELRRLDGEIGFEAQERLYTRAIEARPADALLIDRHGAFLVAHGRDADAEKAWGRVLEILPHHFVVHYKLGRLLTDVERPKEAIPRFEEALRLKPTFAEAAVGLARALEAVDEPDRALLEWGRAVSIDPGLTLARVGRAACLERLGRADEAIAETRELVRLRPEDDQARLHLAETLDRLGKRGDAITELRSTLTSRPEAAELRTRLVTLLEAAGRSEEAIAELEVLCEQRPSDGLLRYRVALALSRAQRWDRARPHAEAAARLLPEDARAHFALGQVLMQTGEPASALRHFEATRRLSPDDASVGRYIDWARKEISTRPPAR